FPNNHELAVGPIGYMGSKAAMHSMKEADVLLAIGTRLSVFGTLPSYDIDYFPKDADIIQIDINPRHIARTHTVEVELLEMPNLQLKQFMSSYRKNTDQKTRNV